METAEQFLKRDESGVYTEIDITKAMIEFAKMHVQAALKAASKNAMGVHCTDYIDPDSILDAYPLTNIK